MRTITMGFLGIMVSALGGCCCLLPKGDAFAKPTPGPEQARLQRFVGTWSGTAELVSPTAEEMNKHMPEGKKVSSTFKGGEKWDWLPGGMTLKGEGWHELPGGEKENWVGFLAWDARKRAYRGWFFNEAGAATEVRWKVSGDGNKWTASAESKLGPRTHGSGTAHWIDDRTVEWNWNECTPMGRMKLKGTNKKQ